MTRPTRSITSWAAGCLVLGALVAGCGGKSEDSASSSGGGGSIKTGPGITEKEISLGLLTDTSGVFAALGEPITQANQLYWKQKNADGGVCDRQVKLVVKDHGYDPQKAVVQYRDMSGDVAGLQQLLGSPITAALLPTLERDSMVSVLAAWPSSLLSKDFVLIAGATYDIETINGLAHQMDEGKLKKGDTIGHLYFEGEYGENGLLGSEAFAEENDLEIVEQKIKATDEDMSGQAAAFKRRGVKAIAVTAGPTQMASLAGIAASQGLNVPLVGNSPTFDPAVLETPAAEALKANAFISAAAAPYNSQEAGPQAAAEAYEKAYPKAVAKASVGVGWAEGEIMFQALEKACEDGDLSREGIVKAARSLSGVDTMGLVAGALDYSKVGEPAGRSTYIARPADAPGGLKAVGEPLESESAKNYELAQ